MRCFFCESSHYNQKHVHTSLWHQEFLQRCRMRNREHIHCRVTEASLAHYAVRCIITMSNTCKYRTHNLKRRNKQAQHNAILFWKRHREPQSAGLRVQKSQCTLHKKCDVISYFLESNTLFLKVMFLNTAVIYVSQWFTTDIINIIPASH